MFEEFDRKWDEFYHKENRNGDWYVVARLFFILGYEFCKRELSKPIDADTE